jgi:hypothetical protein
LALLAVGGVTLVESNLPGWSAPPVRHFSPMTDLGKPCWFRWRHPSGWRGAAACRAVQRAVGFRRIVYRGKNTVFYFPLATCIVVAPCLR